jgi:Holliday junction resolvasome RuvABC endonuclease subunit
VDNYILAIDPATRCGWAVYNNDQKVASGVLDFSSKPTAHAGKRFNNALNEFTTLISKYPIKAIAYEAVKRWQSSQAALVYGGIVSTLLVAAYQSSVPVFGIAPKSAKKRCTGNGNASKTEMIVWANKEFNIQVIDDNEADALAIGYTYIYETANIQKPTSQLPGVSKPTRKKRSRKNLPATN